MDWAWPGSDWSIPQWNLWHFEIRQDQDPRFEMSMSMETVIRARNLTKQFGEEVAVRDLTFEIPRGVIFGFIGPSGSGKTTTIRLLTGIYAATRGELRVLGRD